LDYIFGFTMFRKSVKLKVVIHWADSWLQYEALIGTQPRM
jgi:hypothetical protein